MAFHLRHVQEVPMSTYLRSLYVDIFKLFESIIFCMLSYIVYCNAEEISLCLCLRSRYVGLLNGQNLERVEIFSQMNVLKSVVGRMLQLNFFFYIRNVKLSNFCTTIDLTKYYFVNLIMGAIGFNSRVASLASKYDGSG